MNPDAQVHLRLATLVGVAGIAVLLSGGLAWTSIANPTPIPLPTVRVTSTSWRVLGCPVTNVTGPGGVANVADPLRLTAVLENTAVNAPCRLESATVDIAGFSVDNSSLPFTLGAAGSSTSAAIVTVTVSVPGVTLTTPLAVVVTGATGA